MKKLLFLFAIAGLTLTSCGSDDDGGPDCVGLANASADAFQVFLDENTTASCTDYINSLQELLDNGCVEGAEVAATQAILDSVDCDLL